MRVWKFNRNYPIGNALDVPALRVTACMANLGVETFAVDLYSKWHVLEPEPSVTWDLQSNNYNTESTRLQLGAAL